MNNRPMTYMMLACALAAGAQERSPEEARLDSLEKVWDLKLNEVVGTGT